MKLLVYEVKKIFNVKLLIVLCLFTMLFYNMFMQIVNHPYDSADCRAQNDLATALRDEYGYDTYLPYEDYAVLEEIRQTQVYKLDKMVQESSILQEAGITTYQQLRTMDYGDAVCEEHDRIAFTDGTQEVFLMQQIEEIQNSLEDVMGEEAGKEMEAADTFLKYHSSYSDYTEEAVQRVAEVIKENRFSLMPERIMEHLRFDLQRFGILLIISCLLLILPYQIRERLAGVNPLMATTHVGRGLWNRRYVSAIISCVIVCIAQFMVFCLALQRADVLQYWEYSVSGSARNMFWFDMNLGEYLIAYMILYIVATIGIMTVFYLISRISLNYIVGVAVGIPVTVVVGVLLSQFTNAFLKVERSVSYDVLRPIGFVLIMLVAASIIAYCLHKWDKRRDVFA